MRLGDVGSDAYLAGWDRGAWTAREGRRPTSPTSGRRASRKSGRPAAVTTFLDTLGAQRRSRNEPTHHRSSPVATRVLVDGGDGHAAAGRAVSTPAAPASSGTSSSRDASRAIHEAYAEAGAPLLTTNTFGGTRPRLADARPRGPRARAQRGGARRRPRGRRRHGVLVAGDLGPTGELLEPLGTMTPTRRRQIFEEQLRGLVAGGIDVVLIETMSDLGEVEAAVRGGPGRRARPAGRRDAQLRHQPAHDDGRLAPASGDGARPRPASTRSAPTAAAAPTRWRHRRADGRGAPRGPAARRRSPTPASRSSSATTSSTTRRPPTWPSTPAACTRLGIDLIGACCGSTPEHIAAMRDAVR